jgi:hypothetical protein
MFAQARYTHLDDNVEPTEVYMATLDIYPPVALYVAGRFAHLPRKGHVQDYAIAMNLNEESLHHYAVERALYSPGDVIRSCDLQLAMSDEWVARIDDNAHEIDMQIQRLAHAYKMGLPCNIFLG